jgi:chitinase
MSSRPNIGVIAVYVLLAFFLLNPSSMPVKAQEDDKTEKTAKEDEKKVKKSLKEILSFKNFLHHSDSSRLAKRYIRWHKKLTRTDADYAFTIDRDTLSNSLPFIRENENILTKAVFGWYPSWDEHLYKSLDYSLLSTVAYFAYQVDPKTGKQDTISNGQGNIIQAWKTTPLIDSIQKYEDKKILLTVSLFGNHNNKTFLKNPKAWDTLMDNVIGLIDDRKAHGICLDFEGILNSQKKNYNKFLLAFSQKLKQQGKNYLLYLTVPAVDWNKTLDYDPLIKAVDQFVIMGYNYYGSTSKVAGPVAPLQSGKIWDPFNLSTSVGYYKLNGVPANKLILALPFYGNIWETRTGSKGSKVNYFVGSRTIDYIKSEMDSEKSIDMLYDSISQSAWYSYVVKDSRKNKRQFRQLWFDNDASFAAKLEMIKDSNLTGLGIWALGYNKRYDNYWRQIERSFCLPPDTIDDGERYRIVYPDTIVVIYKESSAMTDSLAGGDLTNKGMKMGKDGSAAAGVSFMDKLSGINDKLKELSGMSDLLILALGFVVIFGGIGFVISMFKPETRMFFFNSKAYTIYFTVILSVFLMVLMRKLEAIRDPSIVLLFGFVMGAIIVYLVSKYVQKVKRNLP